MNESQTDKYPKQESTDSASPTQSPKEYEDSSNKKSNGRHGARNQHRHKHVVKWIAQQFPNELRLATDHESRENSNNHSASKEEQPKRKMHILDVAGGKGELSARMSICHRLNVQMVDPRPANVSECFHKLIFRSLPKKWQQKISQSPNGIEDALKRRFKQHIMYFPSDSESQMCISALESNADLLQAVIDCSLMIGMHSDGATEAIVDIAMKYRKPFMVVPCCVFPNFFKHRFIPRYVVKSKQENDIFRGCGDIIKEKSKEDDMIPVRSHEQFCKYLLMKDSHFTEEILPFEGRNVAICWDGQNLDTDNM